MFKLLDAQAVRLYSIFARRTPQGRVQFPNAKVLPCLNVSDDADSAIEKCIARPVRT